MLRLESTFLQLNLSAKRENKAQAKASKAPISQLVPVDSDILSEHILL